MPAVRPVSLRTRVVARLGGWINRIRRPVTLGVRAIVRDGRGRVLLVRHTYVPGWYLPGGAVDAHESVGEALAREVREEANIRIIGTPRLIGIYFNRRGRSDHVVLFEVTEFEPGRHWAWKVAGVPATRHQVDAVGGGARVSISVPWWSATRTASVFRRSPSIRSTCRRAG